MSIDTTINDQKAIEELNRIFKKQKTAFLNDPYPSLAERKERISKIPVMLQKHKTEIIEALNADFGGHSERGAHLLEIISMLERVKYNLTQIKKWMKPIQKAGNLVTQGNAKVYLKSHPKGVIANMVSWNFPFDIGLGPVIDALGAGNRVIIKPSDLGPHCGELMKKMIKDTFDEDLVAVVAGDLELAKYFPTLPWDHLVYTGSGRVAKLVMESAAKNLVPVTLELGGKNPVIVHEDSINDETIAMIAGVKAVKRGQICVTGDYCLVPEKTLDKFVNKLSTYFSQHFGSDDNGAAHACGIITDRHLKRLHHLVQEATDVGAKVINTGSDIDSAGRHMPFHLIVNPSPELGIMQEEIFGPILPILTYKNDDDIIQHVNAGDHPLGLYIFAKDQAFIDKISTYTHSGGVAVNAIAIQAGQPSLPFGGIGASGMGIHHGEEAFREFSNQRGYFVKKGGGLYDAILPPYDKSTDQLIEEAAYAPLAQQALFALKKLPSNIWGMITGK